MDFKNMRAGYQGKPDAMREMADKLARHVGFEEPDVVMSKSAADKEKMRPYKTGGMVHKGDGITRKVILNSNHHIEKMKKELSKEEEKEKMKEKKTEKDKKAYKKGGDVKCDKRQKFAEGGIGKYRHDQATLGGKQLPKKKEAYKNTY